MVLKPRVDSQEDPIVKVRERRLVPVGEGALFRVHTEGGGPVPHVLKGLYTSRRLAEAAIGAYLSGTNAEQAPD